MPRSRSFALILSFIGLILVAFPAAAPQSGVDGRGPQVGQLVPDFAGQDQTGRNQTRATILGPNGAVLVFLRSADWCPYCRTQLVDLQRGYESLRAKGLGLAAISYDSPAVLTEAASRFGITFPLISDPGSAIIKRYGLLSEQYSPGDRAYGVPDPGTFVIDRTGKVTSRHFGDRYQDRVTVGSLLVRMGAPAGATGKPIMADYLQITPSASAAVVAPGQRFSLVLDVTPAPRIHVYAPGNADYIPINLRVAPVPLLELHEAEYPQGEEYLFEPLNERVQVYQKPFRLIQDATLGATAEAQAAISRASELRIEGEVEYQACDENVCFSPQTVKVTWTVAVQAPAR